MPTCITCGEKEFDCIDGLFYCALCQTQSQDVRVEEQDDFVEGMGRGTAIKEQKQNKETKTKERGRLWTSHEGFQFVILEQVNALIELGASKDIKEVVWRLWVMYLSKIGAAFTNSPEPPKKPLFLTSYPRHRDLQPGNVESPKIKPLRLRKTYRDKQGGTVKKQEKPSELENEEFYKGDNPDSDEDDGDEQDMLLVDEDLGQTKATEVPKSSMVRSVNNKKRKFISKIERMSIRKTLGFCYLGLLFTGSITGPGDLTRWVRIGKLPYFTASSFLPEDLKLSLYDKIALETRMLPKSEWIRVDAYRIAKLLSLIDKLPVPDITLIIHRHIHSLQLPADLHGLTVNLVKSKPPRIYLKEKPMFYHGELITDYDILAMGYIIATLKLLLGLDDTTERKLSTYARKLMDMGNLNQPLFVWEDWYEYMERREAEKEELRQLQNYSQIAEVRDTKSLTKSLEKFSNLYGKHYESDIQYKYKLKPEIRVSLQQCFTLLGEKWIERGTHKPETISKQQHEILQQQSPATLIEQDPIGFLVDSPKKQSTNHNATSSQASTSQLKDGSHFRKSSLRYITKQESFLEELDKQGLTDFTIYSSCLSSSDDQSDGTYSDQSGESPLPHSPIIAQGAKKPRRKKRLRIKEAVINVLSQKSKPKRSRTFDKQDLMYNLEKAYENYRLYSGKTSEANRHQAYDWLLKLCSKTIDCSVEDLDKNSQNLQALLFADKYEQDIVKFVRLQRFFSIYFSQE